MVQTNYPREQLESIAATLRGGGTPPRPSVREFLGWFGARKRGSIIVWRIRRFLERYGLITIPDFDSTWIDGPISFALAEAAPKTGGDEGKATAAEPVETVTTMTSPATALLETDGLAHTEPQMTAGFPDDSGGDDSGSATETPLVTQSPGVGTPGRAEGEGLPVSEPEPSETRIAAEDPTHRLSRLQAANRPPKCVSPDSTLSEAVTIMLANDFSQVPVMPNERDVKGIVTWQSIGSRLALNREIKTARDVMELHAEVRSDESIFAAIADLVKHGYVLVRGPDGKIAGIVTSSDLNLQFQQLAEPFLLLSEIENRIRHIIAGHFDPSELAKVRNPTDDERKIESVDDLTFGEYIRLLEQPERWERVALNVDRKTFIKSLQNVHRIRNEVMHFDTDGPLPEDFDALRDFARFLQRLEMIGVT